MLPRTGLSAGGAHAIRVSTALCSVGALVLCGCAFLAEEGVADPRPRFVAVVMDETDSFAKDWDGMLRSVGVIANRLGSGAGMVVIGMDDSGFQPDDVRIDVRLVDANPLKARVQTQRLVKEIRALTRRAPKRPRTDVLGSVRHAAYFLNKYGDHQPMLIVFSDMRQTPRQPTIADARDLSFPARTAVHCFYVDATGWADWHKTTRTWQELLSQAGATIGAGNFYQRAQTAVEIDRLFPRVF